jgi:Tfp pilus assembly protein PilF
MNRWFFVVGISTLTLTGCVQMPEVPHPYGGGAPPVGTSSPAPASAPAPVSRSASASVSPERPIAKAPELSPNDAVKLCLATAESMEQGGRDTEAIAFYERARKLDPHQDRRATRHLATLYTQVGQHERAKTEYERALRESPKDPELLNGLGYNAYCLGKWAEAEAHLRAALAQDPKHARAWMNLGLTFGQQGRYYDSLEAFRRVVSPGEAYCNLAFVFTVQGKRDEARVAYRAALQHDPNLGLARTALEKLDGPSR